MTENVRPLALLFGASRGLGLALAHELGAQGYRLVITARDDTELQGAAEDLRAQGYAVTTEVGDVSDADQVTATVQRVEEVIGPIEVTLVVAGIISVGALDDLRREDFEQSIDVMLWGPINAALAVLPGMRKRRRGRIGIVSSIGGVIAAPHLLPYSTAKFGAVGFARGLRSELAGSGVTVTAITPGLMRTGSHLRAQFLGRRGAEYGWFAVAASLPVLSADVERAAAQIVTGVLRGRSTVLITPLAHLVTRVAGISPQLTAAVLGLTTRLLPRPARDGLPPVDGFLARVSLHAPRRRLVDRLTALNDAAAKRWRQHR